jgi:hypothetical protein
VIAVFAGLGPDPANALTGALERERFTYRVHEGEVQVLDPSRKTVITPSEGRIVQRDVGTLDSLDVTVATP